MKTASSFSPGRKPAPPVLDAPAIMQSYSPLPSALLLKATQLVFPADPTRGSGSPWCCCGVRGKSPTLAPTLACVSSSPNARLDRQLLASPAPIGRGRGGGEKARHLLPFRDDEGLTPTEARGPQRRRGQSLGGVVSGRPQTSLDETIPRRGIQQGSKLTDSDSSRGGCGAVLGGLG